jgi:hypothetical protein
MADPSAEIIDHDRWKRRFFVLNFLTKTRGGNAHPTLTTFTTLTTLTTFTTFTTLTTLTTLTTFTTFPTNRQTVEAKYISPLLTEYLLLRNESQTH